MGGRLVGRLGIAHTLAAGMAFGAVGLLVYVRLPADGSLADLIPGMIVAGLGQGVPNVGQPARDAPSTVFHLDLLVDAATLHLPFLTGAKLGPAGMLAEDPDHPEVKVALPKIKLSFEQTAGACYPEGEYDADDPILPSVVH